MRVTIINYRISLIIFLGMLVATVIRIISLVVFSSWQNFRIFKRPTPLLAHKPSVALLTLPSLWQLNLFVIIIMSSGRQNWHATLGQWQFCATAADGTWNSRNTLHSLSCSHHTVAFRAWQHVGGWWHCRRDISVYLHPEFRKSTKYGKAEDYNIKTPHYEKLLSDMNSIGRYYGPTKIHGVTIHNTKLSEHPQWRIPKHVHQWCSAF
jgi:hypothetical protein